MKDPGRLRLWWGAEGGVSVRNHLHPRCGPVDLWRDDAGWKQWQIEAIRRGSAAGSTGLCLSQRPANVYQSKSTSPLEEEAIERLPPANLSLSISISREQTETSRPIKLLPFLITSYNTPPTCNTPKGQRRAPLELTLQHRSWTDTRTATNTVL